jgi:tRNA modification GTPase
MKSVQNNEGNKSLEIIDNSDLIIYMLNNNEELTNEELELLSKIKSKKHIIVINKIDLTNKIDINDDNIIRISIKDNIGIDKLKTRIIEMFNLEQITTKDMTYLSNARSISLLKKSLGDLVKFLILTFGIKMHF